MTVAYHEAFPAGYLLVLAPGETPEAGLAYHLDRACRSGKPAVWVDCRLLDTLSATAVWLLWACQHRLQRKRVKMVFCNVSERLDRVLRRIFTCADLRIASSLDEAVAESGTEVSVPFVG